MYSTKCGNCRQLINLKPDEILAAIAETEAAGHTTYQMPCPKCRRPVKIPLKTLKLNIPRTIPESLDGRAAASEPEKGN
jgi:hypothetical protein